MLLVGIVLTVLGFIIFYWVSDSASKPSYQRPLVLLKPIPFIILQLFWLGLIIEGLILIWKVNPIIVGVILGGNIFLWVISYFLGREKASIKWIIKAYNQLKLYRPKSNEKEILKEVARIRLQRWRWDENLLKVRQDIIFKGIDDEKTTDIKELIRSILCFERPISDMHDHSDFQSIMKTFDKRDMIIDSIYEKEIQKQSQVVDRPELSNDVLERIIESGLNPDEMSNEQLAAVEGLENIKKAHWISKPFLYPGLILESLALLSIIHREWKSVVLYGLSGIIISYVGYKIQSFISSKEFRQASIKKHSQERVNRE